MRRSVGLHRAMAIVLALLSLFDAPDASAYAPACATHSSGPHCSYNGAVSRAYINESGWVLIYFDTLLDLNAPLSVGISGVTNSDACLYRLVDDPDFGKLLFAAALAAQSRGASVQLQMHGSQNGYLKCDRIWVEDE